MAEMIKTTFHHRFVNTEELDSSTTGFAFQGFQIALKGNRNRVSAV
jgi:hypothetical protein